MSREMSSRLAGQETRFYLDETVFTEAMKGSKYLGIGSSCTIVEARDIQANIPVAVKVLRHNTDLPFDLERKRLENEANLMMKHRHPNILPVYGQTFVRWESKSLPAIIMLKAVKDISKADLSPKQIANAINAIASALDFVHQNGVAHMSVKSENVLMGELEGLSHFWLTDFGSAIR